MAEKAAHVTFSLTDEMTPGLQAISRQLDELKTKFLEVGHQQSGTGFGGMMDQVKNLTASLKDTGDSMSKLGLNFKSGAGEIAAVLEEAGKHLNTFKEGLAGSGEGIAAFAGTALKLTGVIGGLGLVIYEGVTQLAQWAEKFSAVHVKVSLFRESLGALNDTAIDKFRALGRAVGESADESDAALTKIVNMLDDVRKGYDSNLAQIAQKHPGMMAEFNKLYDDIARKGKAPIEEVDKFMDYLLRQTPEFRRQFSHESSIPLSNLSERYKVAKEHYQNVWEPPKESFDKLEVWKDKLAEHSDRWQQHWDNAVRAVSFTVELALIPTLDKAMSLVDAVARGIAFIFSTQPKEQHDEAYRNRFRPGATAPVNAPPRPPPIHRVQKFGGEEAAGAVGNMFANTDWDKFLSEARRSTNIIDMRRGGGRAPPGSPLGAMPPEAYTTGTDLREINTQGKEGTNYLREIRDIMEWLKSQKEGGGPLGFGDPNSGPSNGPGPSANPYGNRAGDTSTSNAPTSPAEAPEELSKAIPGSGPGGRYTVSDVQAAVRGDQAAPPGFATPRSPADAPEDLAKALGGTGSGGAYTLSDVQSAALGGSGQGSSAFLAEKRAPFAEQLKDPETRKLLGAVLHAENPGDRTAVIESLFNRTEYENEQRAKRGQRPLTIREMMGTYGNSFYGPIKHGYIQQHLDAMNNPATAAKMNEYINQSLAGAHSIGGYTDQGSRGDPNYEAGGTGINMKDGRVVPPGTPGAERFNDWTSAARAWRMRREADLAAADRRPTLPVPKGWNPTAMGTPVTAPASRAAEAEAGPGPKLAGLDVGDLLRPTGGVPLPRPRPRPSTSADRSHIDKSLADQGKDSRRISTAKVDIALADTGNAAKWKRLLADIRLHQTPPMGKAGNYGSDAANQNKEE